MKKQLYLIFGIVGLVLTGVFGYSLVQSFSWGALVLSIFVLVVSIINFRDYFRLGVKKGIDEAQNVSMPGDPKDAEGQTNNFEQMPPNPDTQLQPNEVQNE